MLERWHTRSEEYILKNIQGYFCRMECGHLIENVTLSLSAKTNGLAHRRCSVCKDSSSLWICLSCGAVNCGRYVNGHAKEHAESHNLLHNVCMDCENQAVFCYTCDEFVINDTPGGDLLRIRTHLNSLSDGSESHSKENRKVSRRRSSENVEGGRKKRQKTDEGGKPRVRPRTPGLRNLGNTCFMNAVLQSLSNIQSFCGYIKQLPSLEQKISKKVSTRNSKDGENVLVVEELRKTLVALWQGSKSAISPDSLFSIIWKVVPRFRGYQQQDAHEFMRYLLDRLHSELLTLLPYPPSDPLSPYIMGPAIGGWGSGATAGTKNSVVTAIFGGILQNEVHCLMCGMESKKHDPFLDLSLDIPSKFTAKTQTPPNNEPVCHLHDCLSSFTDIEELEETELYMCSNCKRKQRSTKKFWIRRLPNVLCLHLKRFRWSTYLRVKVDTYINFPLRGLDMSKYLLNNLHSTRNSNACSNEYDLAACVVHHGTGAGSGHYTSYAIHEGVWYHFNDSSVTSCDEQTVASCKAYILFYVKRNIKLPSHLANKIPVSSSSPSTTPLSHPSGSGT